MEGSLAADLGVPDTPALLTRAAAARAFLPRVWAVAEDVMARNPEIHG